MPQISDKKIERIKEQILHYLFESSPEAQFTSKISLEIARDEEFVKSLLLELKQKGLVSLIQKSPSGNQYLKRQRWTLSKQAYHAYKNHSN
jgi:predicted transcriptional regulator with HTH domain